MKRRRSMLCTLSYGVFVLGWLLTARGSDAAPLTATQAKDHVGETATVCGMVASATFAARLNGAPTFLNLDKPYPDPLFTVVIWGSDRPKFGQPEVQYPGKRVCVTGRIKMFRGRSEMVVKEPGQTSEAGVAK